MKHYNIPIFISHFGCPNDCVFCNQKKITGKETDITTKDIEDIIENHLKTLPKNSKKEVAFFGGTFTGISKELQKEYLEVVKRYIKDKKINGVRVSTRPDYIDEERVKLLKSYGVTTIELGVQSLDESVLLKTERFYPIKKVEEAVKIIKKYDIQLGIQLMLGLPGATFESDYETAKKTINLSPNIARIYPTLVIKDTELANQFKKEEYIPLSIDEAVDRAIKIYTLLELNNINVIRVGLQPTDELSDNETLLAGPYHPAFKELVIGEIFFKFFNSFTESRLKIEANQKNISSIVGINKKNRVRLKEKMELKINNNLSRDNFKINDKIYNWREILNFILSEE